MASTFIITDYGYISGIPAAEKDDYAEFYEIIRNEGGGDCFFLSIIDSGLPIFACNRTINLPKNLRKDRDLRSQMVKLLRLIASKYLKHRIETEDDFIDVVKAGLKRKNIDKWYDDMLRSSYYADDFMISSLAKIQDFIPIMINSKTEKIYCGVLPFSRTINIGNRKVTYNSIESLQSSTSPFIIIWYISGVHFENIRYNSEDAKTIFYGFEELSIRVPELVEKIINECHLLTEDDARKVFAEKFKS